MKAVFHFIQIAVAYLIIAALGLLVVGACVALLPVRWIPDSSARREKGGRS